MQNFPEVPGNDAVASVFANVAPENRSPIVSDAALEVEAQIRRLQGEARVDPILNGANAKRVRRS
jgi:hypothetical protein